MKPSDKKIQMYIYWAPSYRSVTLASYGSKAAVTFWGSRYLWTFQLAFTLHFVADWGLHTNICETHVIHVMYYLSWMLAVFLVYLSLCVNVLLVSHTQVTSHPIIMSNWHNVHHHAACFGDLRPRLTPRPPYTSPDKPLVRSIPPYPHSRDMGKGCTTNSLLRIHLFAFQF